MRVDRLGPRGPVGTAPGEIPRSRRVASNDALVTPAGNEALTWALGDVRALWVVSAANHRGEDSPAAS